jgi:ATP-binding cassette subfamily C protein CydD
MHTESTTSAGRSLTLNEQESRALRWLKRVSKKARGTQLQVFVVRLGQLAAQICAFWFFSVLAQRIVVEQQAVFLDQLTPFIWAVGVWAFCTWLADTLSYKAKFAIESALERQVHQVLQTKQTAITRKYSSTYWQQLMLTNLNDVGDYLTQYSVQKWISGLAPLVVLLVILPVNYLVALALLLTMPIVPLFMILVGRGAAQLHRKHFVALERLGDMFSDRLKGLSLITATGQHPHQLTRLDNASKVVNRKTMNVVSVAFLSSTVLDFFSTVSIALVAVFIGFTMLGELNIGPSVSFNQGLFMLLVAPLLFAELRMLGKLYHQKAKAEAGAERFEAVLKESHQAPVSTCSGDFGWINFHVHAPALHANQLNVKKGDWIRLTGASGSGKTSLLEALMGFREASHALADDAALLSQQTYVLDNTLAFNLHLGARGYANEHLVQVLSDVGLQDWYASLPDGLATELGDYPAMSGGEAQRLALARILLLQNDIVLLDEPTAHLTETLHTQLATLIHDQLRDKTVIWASHKPLPEAWFDQLWMVSEGQIEVRY